MEFVRKVALLLRTVQHLRISQIVYQIWYRVRPAPKVLIKKDVKINTKFGQWTGNKYAEQSYFPANLFRFLNKSATISFKDDWNDPSFDKLWLYNLHYFDDLTSHDSHRRTVHHKKLLHQWIVDNPIMCGNGWEPYPLSLRIVNWIKWLSVNRDLLDDKISKSLHRQILALEKQLEFHILANHLFANIKALCFAGAFFEGQDATRWREKGFKLLKRELKEQFLADGAHYERSPMYHCILSWDLLDLYSLIKNHLGENEPAETSFLLELLSDSSKKALGFLHRITHPDGDIAFFNDTTLGIAPRPAALHDYAHSLGLKPEVVKQDFSGFVKIDQGSIVLISDVGEIAPSYQPGHSHAEAGAFELSVHGQRVLVNSGISEYNVTSKRLYQRGISAHNCATQLNHLGVSLNSSEVWSGFRVGRRAKVSSLLSEDKVNCTIKGLYSNQKSGPVKTEAKREIRVSTHEVTVVDTIIPGKDGKAYFHFHPSCTVYPISNNQFLIKTPSATVSFIAEGAKVSLVNTSVWCAGFGKEIERPVIEIEFNEHLVSSIRL